MEKRVILSVKDLVVKFRVRSKILTAIRNVSFDIYDGETVAIVGESGSGKSVLTKSFTSMLESNGYIAKGSINYFPSEGAKEDQYASIKEPVDLVRYHRNGLDNTTIRIIKKKNNETIKKLKEQIADLKNEDNQNLINKKDALIQKAESITSRYEFSNNNKKMVERDDLMREANRIDNFIKIKLDSKKRERNIIMLENRIKELEQENYSFAKIKDARKKVINKGINLLNEYLEMADNKQQYFVNSTLAPFYLENLKDIEFYGSTEKHLAEIYKELTEKEDHKLSIEEFDFLKETWSLEKRNNLTAKFKAQRDLRNLRGGTIATIFQDPMTSLNPLLTVGYQIIDAIREHQKVSYPEAKRQAVELLTKVGIPNPAERMKDIPGKYSGGMRQRVVIAIALACKPKILICDEPTTALDVTIQAQILQLIKDLKKEYGFTVIFITHDLGVVANVADRVAVVYAGQIIEYGLTNEIFFDPKHPYTWALLSSLPQLGRKGDELFAIDGTPPSLFNEIKGDAFAPRNKYALEIDYQYEPPMFEVSPTHFAKTWLLDPRSPKVEKPKELNRLKEAVENAKVGD